jgi:C-terminal processing protease CtpA/Prc
LVTYLKGYRDDFDLAIEGKIPDEKITKIPSAAAPFEGAKGFDHPIIILADRLCGSSGESTLAMLRMHPRAKSYGENTYGAIHFGNQGIAWLPMSGIRIQMGTHYVSSRDGGFYESVGYPPDFRTPLGKDAMDTVKADLLKSFSVK